MREAWLVLERNSISLVNDERIKRHLPPVHFEFKLLLDGGFEKIGKLVTTTYGASKIYLESDVINSGDTGCINHPLSESHWGRSAEPFREIRHRDSFVYQGARHSSPNRARAVGRAGLGCRCEILRPILPQYQHCNREFPGFVVKHQSKPFHQQRP